MISSTRNDSLKVLYPLLVKCFLHPLWKKKRKMTTTTSLRWPQRQTKISSLRSLEYQACDLLMKFKVLILDRTNQ